jgi:hypothetical protein
MSEASGLSWQFVLFAIVGIISISCVLIAAIVMDHPFIIRIEMDDNTLEAIQSLNYSAREDNSPIYPGPSVDVNPYPGPSMLEECLACY